ncbi:hypothetical protein C2845_PM09G09090 [Panicum miliaceum]|uniref:Uncharacterized protein n=1 Tax=Panicum miliaceum TaxID=4540 RepID=A0A3L6S233_PANMI|nr:hypothetical protein C2845_PM09G09090 [Panicum miliaceum]
MQARIVVHIVVIISVVFEQIQYFVVNGVDKKSIFHFCHLLQKSSMDWIMASVY